MEAHSRGTWANLDSGRVKEELRVGGKLQSIKKEWGV